MKLNLSQFKENIFLKEIVFKLAKK